MTEHIDESKEVRRPTTIAINLEDSTQAIRWAEHFGVTRAELLVAILEAGVDADLVRKVLRK